MVGLRSNKWGTLALTARTSGDWPLITTFRDHLPVRKDVRIEKTFVVILYLRDCIANLCATPR